MTIVTASCRAILGTALATQRVAHRAAAQGITLRHFVAAVGGLGRFG